MSNNTLATISVLDDIEVTQMGEQVRKIRQFQQMVNSTLSNNQDYGIIPGTQKPTLLKPGAEKILMLLGLSSEYNVIEKIEDWDRGIFAYTIKCQLFKNGQLITEGIGSCNSKEDKYRYRWVRENDVPAQCDKETLKKNNYGKYRIDNDEIYSVVNTILKMAKKRAQIDATLTVASLSDVFTQDMEDMRSYIEAEKVETMDTHTAENIKLTFGKHKGKTLGEMIIEAPDYLDWLMKQERTNPELKAAIKNLIDADLEVITGKPEEMTPVDEGDLPF